MQGRPAARTIAHELVESIRGDLTVDWADREATEAKIRAKIKRLLRKHSYKPASARRRRRRRPKPLHQLVLDQAKALYRYWPEVEDRLFD